ncbi:NAD(P)-dependent oxidoreductase [Nannocystis sp. RBIL2]|uniref:NAD(P)-dependent oxidoreductase n=1 Tax=Nannocystis sp. RBIL2 TaxID=2996788 RepID=UPI0022713A1D|nr:NAD(P)-dependent oxidoreductase [Nannocystis sp. RBIL2]MCY1067240.1 NAD(P)-dependent oxidoreductase [Nannocystis sp. RBIL2]
MTTTTKAPVLIVGGSGVVGSIAAKFLRRLHPDLPIAIGGRDFLKARAVADELGNADAVVVDLARADLGQPAERAFSAVVMFLKDDTLHSLEFAQARGVPYLEISTAAFELAPLVGLYVARPKSAPILLDGYWLAGAATLAAVQLAREFRSVEAIELAAVLDEQDVGGPAAYADLERQTKAVTSALQLVDGQWKWVGGEAGSRVFKAVDGRELTGQGYSLLDVLSLATATGARSIRSVFALGESSSRRRGEPFSTEIILEITGTRSDGTTVTVRQELVHPQGQAPITAVGVAVGVERLLGLAGGPPVPPGLYLPHVIIEPEHLLGRLVEFGTQIRRA